MGPTTTIPDVPFCPVDPLYLIKQQARDVSHPQAPINVRVVPRAPLGEEPTQRKEPTIGQEEREP